nr:zinc finger bed domain-containing protein ricesleeper 1 [Quercus suber]
MSGEHAKKNALDAEVRAHSLDNESFGGTNENVGENLVFDETKRARAFALWVCAEDVPLRAIEVPSFLDLVHTLNPLANPLNVKMVKAECLKIFKEEKVKIKQVLADFNVKILKDRVQKKKKLRLNGRLFHVYCCAGMLRVIVRDALAEIADIIDEVLHFAVCAKPSPFWHLTYVGLKEASELYSMGEFFGDEYHGIQLPLADVWHKAEAFVKLLGSIYNVAKKLFEAKYPTANNYLHNLQELRASLIHESMSTDSDGKFQVAAVLDALQTLYDEYANTIDENEKPMSKSSASFECEGSDGPCPKIRRVEEGCGSSKDGFDWAQEYKQFIQPKDLQVLCSFPLKNENPCKLPFDPNYLTMTEDDNP